MSCYHQNIRLDAKPNLVVTTICQLLHAITNFIIHKISDEVMENVNVLGFTVLNMIFWDIYGTHVITEQCHDILFDIVLLQHFFIHNNWMQLLHAIMYSYSLVDNETKFCLLLNQEIKFLPRKKYPPDVLFLSPALSSQSTSQYLTSIAFVSWVYKIPYS